MHDESIVRRRKPLRFTDAQGEHDAGKPPRLQPGNSRHDSDMAGTPAARSPGTLAAMWSPEVIAAAAAEGLRTRALELDTEQAVEGIDALDEKEIHPLLAQGLRLAGWGVIQEQPYPSSRLSRPQDRDRLRCDLVLTPEPGQTLVDKILAERERNRAAETLFANVAESRMDTSEAVDPREAMWLEVKVVGQYTALRGASEPNATYASEMTRGPLGDLRKLASDPAIAHAGTILVMFTESQRIAEHDLDMVTHRCLDAGLDVAAPVTTGLPILNRMGNGWATVGLIRLRGLM